MKYLKFSFLILLIIFISSDSVAQLRDIESIINSIKNQYAPDTRVAIFDIQCNFSSEGIIVSGEIDNQNAKTELLNTIKKKYSYRVTDKIRMLPDASLGDKTQGIVSAIVGDVRKHPGNNEELVTQVLLGTKITLFKKEQGYFLIQMPDKYLGWIDTQAVISMSQSKLKSWDIAPQGIITAIKGNILSQPNLSSDVICTIILGCILKIRNRQNGWIGVEFIDGTLGFIPEDNIQDLNEWKNTRLLSAENVEKTAKSLLNIPYLWGGTSVRGFDCSGFTKTVFKMNGFELNRDADQQVKQGLTVNPGKDFQNLRKGDLIFFGQKQTGDQPEQITHVGIYLGNQLYIHSQGHKQVRINSFDKMSALFDKQIRKIFLHAKRIITQ